MPTIAVDAMGGDAAPEEVVKGVAQVSTETSIECLLVGDEQLIQAVLDTVPYNPAHIAIQHTPDWIAADESPKEAVRKKRQASILVATQLVAAGDAQAVVTAGNTGAAVLACARNFPMIPGVHKAALASVYPRQVAQEQQDQLALLLDVGATTRCTAEDLLHFALMGHAYARGVSKIERPRVALLNMGQEATKGGEVLTAAYRQLQRHPALDFVGNVEGNDLTTGKADVIVCEGLLGNVVLKLLEGVAEMATHLAGTAQRDHWRWKLSFMMVASDLGHLRYLTDYSSYGGAPILGFEHLLIKSHGRSNALAIANAIKVAAKAVRDRITTEIATHIQQAS